MVMTSLVYTRIGWNLNQTIPVVTTVSLTTRESLLRLISTPLRTSGFNQIVQTPVVDTGMVKTRQYNLYRSEPRSFQPRGYYAVVGTSRLADPGYNQAVQTAKSGWRGYNRQDRGYKGRSTRETGYRHTGIPAFARNSFFPYWYRAGTNPVRYPGINGLISFTRTVNGNSLASRLDPNSWQGIFELIWIISSH